MAHIGETGLQNWSCGSIYPWSVVIYCGKGDGYCRAEHLIDGRKLAKRRFSRTGAVRLIDASLQASKDAEQQLTAENEPSDYVSSMQALAELGYPGHIN